MTQERDNGAAAIKRQDDRREAPKPPDKSYEKAAERPVPPPYPVSRLVVRKHNTRG